MDRQNVDFWFAEFKEIIENLIVNDDLPEIADAIDRLFMDVDNINRTFMTEAQDAQVEEMAVNLWNWAVSKKIDAVITQDQKAKSQHVACRLVCMCESSATSEEGIRRLVLMSMKTGKGWVDVGNPVVADEFLEIAMSCLEQMYENITEKSSTEAHLTTQKSAVEKDFFKVLSFQAESAIAQDNFERASSCVMRCKDMLIRFPQMVRYLHILCYNFGVETYIQDKFEESSFWLSQSYDIGKSESDSVEAEMLAKTLRFLATVYLDWDEVEYYDKALNAVNLANKENVTSAGLLLKMKVLLVGETAHEELLEAVTEVLYYEMPLEFCLNIVTLLIDNARGPTGMSCLTYIYEHFKSLEDYINISLFHLDILIKRKEYMLAKEKMEEIISGHQRGKRLSVKAITYLHDILWENAARIFQGENYNEALRWYNYSLKFYECDERELNVAKLKRNIASCYMRMDQLVKARKTIEEAEEHDPTNIFTQFYKFKIAVLEGISDTALDAVNTLDHLLSNEDNPEESNTTDRSTPIRLLNLAAKFALEKGEQTVAEQTLEYFIKYSGDIQEILPSLKCLLCLSFPKVSEMPESEEKAKILKRLASSFNTALLKITQYFHEALRTPVSLIDEINWFRKIAWNLAVRCAKEPVITREFFMLSYNLSRFCPCDEVLLNSQKTCLMVATSLDLEQARKNSIPFERTMLLNQALQQISQCKEIWTILKETGSNSDDSCESLLLLYEFEARAKQNDPSLENFVAAVWEQPDVETKTLEAIAALAMDMPAYYPSIATRALKMALLLYKKDEQIDVFKYSVCVRNLMNLLVPDRMPNTELCSLEELWDYFEDALNLLSNNEENYPEMEILVLMIKSWNIGILMNGSANYVHAEKWCGLGLRFLQHLGPLKELYETQMNVLYGGILSSLAHPRRSHFY